MAAAIECRELRKTYPGKPPVEAVRGVDIVVEEGECFGLLGPNGAGKTTTIEILEGLLQPTSGDVQVLGMRWADQPDAIRHSIGISLQETIFSEKLTVQETLRLFRSFYQSGPDPQDAMRMVGLEEKADAFVKNLSGGQKQRLAIAVSLTGDPRLLFLDEPTTGLDPHSRRQLWEIIGRFRREGRTVLLTTHYMDEAQQLCDRVAIVDRGHVISEGSPAELIARLGSGHIVELGIDPETARPLNSTSFSELPAVTDASIAEHTVRLAVAEPHRAIPAVLEKLREDQQTLVSLTTRQASLDDVFVQLTGRHLEEGEDVA